MGMSFEDALTSYETTRVKKKGKKHGRKNFQSSLFKADKKDGMKKRGDKGRSRWSPDDRDHTCAHKNSCHESTLTGKPSGEITTGPRNVLLKKVPSLKLVKANISISRQSSKSDASSSPDPSTTSHDHATMSCDSVSVSSHHPVTMSHDSTTDRPVIQKEGKGKGKARRGSVSSPPSHHPCGPYINLSRLSLELKQAATLSSHLMAATTFVSHGIWSHGSDFTHCIPFPVDFCHTRLRGGPRVATIMKLVLSKHILPHLSIKQFTCSNNVPHSWNALKT